MNRKKLYEIIFETDTRAGRIFDEILLVLILIGTIVVMLASVTSIQAQYGELLFRVGSAVTVIFTIEYTARIMVHPKPSQYIFSFYGVIDLLAILPGFLSGLVGAKYILMVRSLRLLRLFRIFDLGKYESAGSLLWESIKASATKITVFLICVIIIVSIVGTGMYLIEGSAAGFNNIPISIYRSIVTITTVGYGDITPLTPAGQALSAVLMLVGYGIIAIPTGIVTAEIATKKAKDSK